MAARKRPAGQAEAEPLHDRLARRVRLLRRDRGLTQERLAARASLSADSIRRLETSGFSPTLRVLDKLASALRVPIEGLISEAPERSETLNRLLLLLGPREQRDQDLVLRLARAALADRAEKLSGKG